MSACGQSEREERKVGEKIDTSTCIPVHVHVHVVYMEICV